MLRRIFLRGCACLVAVAGCQPAGTGTGVSPPVGGRVEGTPPVSQHSARKPAVTTGDARSPEISWDTDRDRTFADFLRDKSGGMVRKAAVGIDRHGVLRVELDQSVAPEDTLNLTKSILSGARRDFPDRPITMSVYDPNGAPILRARYRPGEGVHYQIAHEGTNASPRRDGERTVDEERKVPAEPPTRSGVTEADRKFATWAEDHGRAYLRYVEADLERHGRLWFGVTREVKPGDVPELTRSLLQGAQTEFPRRDLVATVFDPEGERIGKAHLGRDGQVRWEH